MSEDFPQVYYLIYTISSRLPFVVWQIKTKTSVRPSALRRASICGFFSARSLSEGQK